MVYSFLKNKVHYQLPADQLVLQILERGEGVLSNTEALLIRTGEFTGRSPDDKFIVRDAVTEDTVHWNRFNNAMPTACFLALEKDLLAYLEFKEEVWMRDVFACADERYRLPIRMISELPASSHFAANMFISPQPEELLGMKPEWQVIHAPGFQADPVRHGTRKGNFTVVSFRHKKILIGGTGYTGEIKKGVFTILNYLLPLRHAVLPMHCSANVGKWGDTALFFGLSGTGKTTLSSDPARELIGDDEHGWDEAGVFNFEGGCYAKIIDLSEQREPEIYSAVRTGALVENAGFLPGTNGIDFKSREITENTRVSYPLNYISNARIPSVTGIPQNIFFLTCDAYGVLPPISKLTPEQAMFYYINGYTAKVAGTEVGVMEPQITFSSCFGAPFLPLHPDFYAEMFRAKIEESGATVWMINTGWTGGPYGAGHRISLAYTRAMLSAALGGELDDVVFSCHPLFGLWVPQLCPGVPAELLNPRDTWEDALAYDRAAVSLLTQFAGNYERNLSPFAQTMGSAL